ncbi:hypothetical protein N9B44_00130 [bacterium]|nr:hypothetical protein [bacterium]
MASNTKPPIDPKQHEALQNEVADILLGPDSPVRGMDDFEQFINEQNRLVQRQAELKSLDTKLVEILPGIEQVEAKLAEAEKELAAEKKTLAGFATELGTAAFAGLRAGELPDNPLFSNRTELQSRIDSLQRQKAELVAGENAGMMEKAKIQAQQLKLAGQIKVEEFKISKADRALGESMLTSKEKLSVRCSHTEEVLKAIASQRKQVTAAREKVKQAENVVEDHKASAAEALGQSTARDASSLKSELKEVRQEHRQNKDAITSVRGSAVAQALKTESLREEAVVGEKLKQLWSLNFDLEANKPQRIKMVDESVSRFKGLPPKFKYGAYGVAGVVVLLAGLKFLMGPAEPSEDLSAEIASSLGVAVREAEAMSAQANASLKEMEAERAAMQQEQKKLDLQLGQKRLENIESEKLLKAQNELRQKQDELKRKQDQAKRDRQKLQRELENQNRQKLLAAQKERKEEEERIEKEENRKKQMNLRRVALERAFSRINLDPMIKVSKSVTSIAEVKSKEIRGPNYLKYQTLYRNKDWLGLYNLYKGESWTQDDLPSASDIGFTSGKLKEKRFSVFFETDLPEKRNLWLVSEGYFSFGYRVQPVSLKNQFKPHPDGHGWTHEWQPEDGRAILYFGSGETLRLKVMSANSQMDSKIKTLQEKIKLGEATKEDAVKESVELFNKLQDEVFNWAMVNQP